MAGTGPAMEAQLRVPVDQPAGAEMGADEELVEERTLVLAARELAAGADAEVVEHRVVVLRAAPERDADA